MKKIKAIIKIHETWKLGIDQLKSPIIPPMIAPNTPMTAPNKPATSPNSAPKIPVQIGNVKIIRSTMRRVELERDILKWFAMLISKISPDKKKSLLSQITAQSNFRPIFYVQN
jgi:hypothetical protein